MPGGTLLPYSSLRSAPPMSASLSTKFSAILGQGPEWPVELRMDRPRGLN
jgi:hypothetical protein